MNDFILKPTMMTPVVNFSANTGVLSIEGECYPENANQFFEPILEWVRQFMRQEDHPPVEFNFKLNYFNTSTAKCLLDLLELLDEYARHGAKVRVIWHYHEDDDDILQSGEEFAEDVSLKFTFVSH